jgi:branched-chain amino acid transport system substrate-binding protein
MKQAFKKTACALVCASAAALAYGQTVVKIGSGAPLTGPNAHYGKDIEHGITLALEDLNGQRLTIGGKTMKFELMSKDDASDPKTGTQIAQQLVDAGVSAVIGHFNSSTTIPASRIYHAAGIPQVSPAATNPRYTMQKFNTAFRVVPTDDQLGGNVGRDAVNQLKLKRFAVVDDRTAYGQGLAEEFIKAVKEAGGQIVTQQYTNNQASDFRAILTTIKSVKPDAIFYGGMDAQGGPLMRQMKELQLDVKVLGADGICSPEMVKLAGDAIGSEQLYCSESGVALESMPGGPRFRDRFKSRFGVDVQVYSPYAYDAMMIVAEAMKRANSTEPKAYLPELARIQYKGVTGGIEFDGKGDLKQPTMTIYTFKGPNRIAVSAL